MKIKASNFNKLMILTGNRFIELEIIDIHVDFLNIILIKLNHGHMAQHSYSLSYTYYYNFSNSNVEP